MLPALLPPGLDEAQMGAVPSVGDQSAAILMELGYTQSQVAELTESGAI